MKSKVLLTCCAVGLLPGAVAYAQESQSQASQAIEEIIVTAEKREENIMDVPLTVSAFNDQLIEELGITNELDLEQLVPGLQFGDDTERTGHGTVIRGIGSRLSGEQHTDLAVATYVDGVYTHSGVGIAPNLFDVERVEVGRGPQGTLNGRNSIAGSISFVTKRPTEEWDLDILTEFTDQVTQRYNVAWGGPLTDNLMFRLTGGYHEGDGAQKNRGLGDDYDAPDEVSYAPQLRFRTDRLDVNVRYAFTEDTGVERTNLMLWEPNRQQPFTCYWLGNEVNQRPDAFRNVREGDFPGEINGAAFDCEGTAEDPTNEWYLAAIGNPAVEDCGGALANNCDDLKNEVAMNRTGGNDTTRASWTLNANFDITSRLTLRYTYGKSNLDQVSWKDGDYSNRVGSAADPSLSSDGGVPFTDRFLFAPYRNDNESHELQLFSNFDGPLNFIVGLYRYENFTYWETSAENFGFRGRNIDNEANARAAGYASCAEAFEANQGWFAFFPQYGVVCREPGFNRNYNFNTEAWSKTEAVFASADYTINDRWAVSGGLRWTEDTKWRDQDFVYDALAMWAIDGADGNSYDIVLLWTASEKAPLLVSDQNPTWDDVIWNVSLEYRPNDSDMIYGRISTGFRAGGFNSASGFNPPIEEETLINYELGIKALFLEDRLNIRAATFLEDYDNFQHTAVTFHPDPNPTMSSPLVEFTDNIDGTRIWGVEAEYTYFLNENWRASGHYAYLGSELGTFSAIVPADPNAQFIEWQYLDVDSNEMRTNVIQEPQNWGGGRLPIQPEHSGSLSLSYQQPMEAFGGGVLQLLGTLSYTGDRYPYVQNVESQKMAAYKRLDLRAGFSSADDVWGVTVYVQNALQEVGLIEYLPANTNTGQAVGALTEARQFGVQLRWRPQQL